MSVTVGPGPHLVPSKPATVVSFPSAAGRAFAVGPDGRFLLNVPVSFADGNAAARQPLVFVQHWFEELKTRVPK